MRPDGCPQSLIHLDGSEKTLQQATGLLQAPSSHEEFSDSVRDAHIALIRNVRIPDFFNMIFLTNH